MKKRLAIALAASVATIVTRGTLAAAHAPSATERLRERLLEIGRSDKFVYSWSTASSKWTEKGFDTFRQQAGVSPIFCFCEFRDIGGTWYSPKSYDVNRANLAATVTREYRRREGLVRRLLHDHPPPDDLAGR